MGLIFTGNDDFEVAGPKRWHRDGWELDRLVIPWRGSVEDLEDFLDSHPIWEQSDVDTNMYLADYPSDDHKQFPTVSLTYIGKRGGALPPDRTELTSSIQQTSGIAFSDAFILTFGLPPHWTAKITYTSQVTRFTTWSRTPPNFDQITAPVPPDIAPADIASLVVGGVDYSVWIPAQPYYEQIVEWVLQWFQQRTVKYTSYQEVVPGQYYRANVTQQLLLLPVQEEIVSS